jgi:hypothetical protein
MLGNPEYHLCVCLNDIRWDSEDREECPGIEEKLIEREITLHWINWKEPADKISFDILP